MLCNRIHNYFWTNRYYTNDNVSLSDACVGGLNNTFWILFSNGGLLEMTSFECFEFLLLTFPVKLMGLKEARSLEQRLAKVRVARDLIITNSEMFLMIIRLTKWQVVQAGCDMISCCTINKPSLILSKGSIGSSNHGYKFCWWMLSLICIIQWW